MKKNQKGIREENGKLRRLPLRRETIKTLDDPALFRSVQAGLGTTSHTTISGQANSSIC